MEEVKNVGSSITLIFGEHCDNPWGEAKKGAKLRNGLYIEYDSQTSIFYHNR
jgi:hypothetical protein